MTEITITDTGVLNIRISKLINDSMHSWSLQIVKLPEDSSLFIDGDKLIITSPTEDEWENR